MCQAYFLVLDLDLDVATLRRIVILEYIMDNLRPPPLITGLSLAQQAEGLRSFVGDESTWTRDLFSPQTLRSPRRVASRGSTRSRAASPLAHSVDVEFFAAPGIAAESDSEMGLNDQRADFVALLGQVFDQFACAQPQVGVATSQLSTRLDRKSWNVFVKSLPRFREVPSLVLDATFERSCTWGRAEEDRLIAVEMARRHEVERQRLRLMSRQKRRHADLGGDRDTSIPTQRRKSQDSKKRYKKVKSSNKLMNAEWRRIDPSGKHGASFAALERWTAESFPLLAQRARVVWAFRAMRTRSNGDAEVDATDVVEDGFVERENFGQFLALLDEPDAERVQTAPAVNASTATEDHFAISPRRYRAMLAARAREEDEVARAAEAATAACLDPAVAAAEAAAAAAAAEGSSEEEEEGEEEGATWAPPCHDLTLAGFVGAVESVIAALAEAESAKSQLGMRSPRGTRSLAGRPGTAESAASRASSRCSRRPTTAQLYAMEGLLPTYAAVHAEVRRVFAAASPARMYRRATPPTPHGLFTVENQLAEWSRSRRAERRQRRLEAHAATLTQRAQTATPSMPGAARRAAPRRVGSLGNAPRVTPGSAPRERATSAPPAESPSASVSASPSTGAGLPKEARAASLAVHSARAAARECVPTPGMAGRALMAESFLPPVDPGPATSTAAPARAASASAALPGSAARIQSPLRKERLPVVAPPADRRQRIGRRQSAAAAAYHEGAKSAVAALRSGAPSRSAPRNAPAAVARSHGRSGRGRYEWLNGTKRAAVSSVNERTKPKDFWDFTAAGLEWRCPACTAANSVLRSFVAVRSRKSMPACRVACGTCAASHVAAVVVPALRARSPSPSPSEGGDDDVAAAMAAALLRNGSNSGSSSSGSASTSAASSPTSKKKAASPSHATQRRAALHRRAIHLVEAKVHLDTRQLEACLEAGTATPATEAYANIFAILQMKQFCDAQIAESSKDDPIGACS